MASSRMFQVLLTWAICGRLSESTHTYSQGKALRMLLNSYVDFTLPQGIIAELPSYEESSQVDNEH